MGLWPLSAALCLLALVGATATCGADEGAIVVHIFKLEHQSAAEAVALIHPHLSERGTVELRPSVNTVVVRDTRPAIDAIVPLLRDFDRPARAVRLEINVVSAGTGDGQGETDGALPEELLERLRELLRYQSYRLKARAAIDVEEGGEVAHRLGDFEVEFRMGTVGSDRRIKLHGFRILRRRDGDEPRSLIHTNLNLWLDRPMVLGLAKTETAERALMVVLNCSRGEDVAAAGEGAA